MLNKKEFPWHSGWLPFLFVVTTVLSMIPLCRIGFTTADDWKYYLTALKGDFWDDAKFYATYSCRFYFLLTKPLYSLPYIFDNFIVTKIFQIGALLFSYGAFAAMIKRIFRNPLFTTAIFALLTFFTPVTQNLYIPFIAYPFFFCFSFGLTCLAVIAFLKFTETQKYKFVILSAVLFLITTLFYETYLVFLALFCLFLLIRSVHLRGLGKMWKDKDFYKEIVPYIIVGALYVGTYFVFRMFVSNEYDGSTFAAHFSLANAWRVMHRCTAIMFPCKPLNIAQSVLCDNSLIYTGHYKNAWFMVTHASILVYVNTALQLFIIGFLLKNYRNRLSYKALLITAASAAVFALSSHLLLALSEKYNAVWSQWILGYVTSYYAYFGVMLTILALTCLLLKLTFSQKTLRHIACALVLATSAVLLILTGYSNDNLSREWQRIQMSHKAINELVKEHVFDQVNDSDILLYPDLYKSGLWGWTLYRDDPNIWADYINLKTGKQLRGCQTAAQLNQMLAQDSTARVFYLSKLENKVHSELMLSLSQIDKSTLDLSSDNPARWSECSEADLFYYSPCKQFTLAVHQLGQDTTQAVLNRHDTLSLQPGWNMLNLNYVYHWRKQKSPIAIIHLSGKHLAADDFRIFNMQNERDTIYEILPQR